MLVDTVTWSGNATDDRAISFSGDLASVTPDLIILKGDEGSNCIFSTDTMTSGESGKIGVSGVMSSGLIKSLTSGGFTVGTVL